MSRKVLIAFPSQHWGVLTAKLKELRAEGYSRSAYFVSLALKDLSINDGTLLHHNEGKKLRPRTQRTESEEPEDADHEEDAGSEQEKKPEEASESQPDFQPALPSRGTPPNRALSGACARCHRAATVYSYEDKEYCSECLDSLIWGPT